MFYSRVPLGIYRLKYKCIYLFTWNKHGIILNAKSAYSCDCVHQKARVLLALWTAPTKSNTL
jgi:hypothetical protein